MSSGKNSSLKPVLRVTLVYSNEVYPLVYSNEEYTLVYSNEEYNGIGFKRQHS